MKKKHEWRLAMGCFALGGILCVIIGDPVGIIIGAIGVVGILIYDGFSKCLTKENE